MTSAVDFDTDYASLLQSAKKTDAPSPDDKAAKAKTEAGATKPAGDAKSEDTPVKKRK